LRSMFHLPIVQRRYVTIILLSGLVRRIITPLRRARAPIRRAYLANGVEGVLRKPNP
jgi:hypothetical protein